MCLQRIVRKYKKETEGIGYKLFRIADSGSRGWKAGDLLFEYYGHLGRRKVTLNRWLTARESDLRIVHAVKFISYTSGFHIYLKRPRSIHGSIVVKVRFRGGHTLGTNVQPYGRRNLPTVVAREMYVPKPKKEK